MGKIHNLHCSKCGYGIKAWIGIGMMYAPGMIFEGQDPELVSLVDDTKISTAALKLVKKGKKVSEHYGHAMYSCPNDYYLFNKFYFKVGDMEPAYPCPYCDATLKRVNFAKGKIGSTRLKFVGLDKYWHCPKCGNDSLNEISIANWD